MKHIDDQTVEILKTYFEFDRLFDLKQYDTNNMSQLYFDLEKLTKESYSPNYRFIFLHYETEYYFDKKYPGLTLINLQRILAALDISNYFCLILTQQDLSHHLRFLQKQETTDLTSIDSIKYQNYYWTNEYLCEKASTDLDLQEDQISKKYLCLNRNLRFHRRVIFSLLNNNNLLNDGIVSYLGLDSPSLTPSLEFSEKLKNKKNLCLLENSTATRVNDQWLLHDEYIKKSVSAVPIGYSFKNFNEIEDPTLSLKFIDASLEQQCFLHVISETVYNYPSSFLTKKSLKPIIYKRPFVLVGPAGSIKNLHSIGFKTFGQWWDESYDQIEDNEKRMLLVLQIIKQICSIDISSLQDMCKQMKNVLEYNFNFYRDSFKNQEIDRLHNFCQMNLKPRYD